MANMWVQTFIHYNLRIVCRMESGLLIELTYWILTMISIFTFLKETQDYVYKNDLQAYQSGFLNNIKRTVLMTSFHKALLYVLIIVKKHYMCLLNLLSC